MAGGPPGKRKKAISRRFSKKEGHVSSWEEEKPTN
jgi:hypothetical protein